MYSDISMGISYVCIERSLRKNSSFFHEKSMVLRLKIEYSMVLRIWKFYSFVCIWCSLAFASSAVKSREYIHLHLSFNRKRIQGRTSRLDPVSEQIINELKTQNETLQTRINEMNTKMLQILNLVQDIHTKNCTTRPWILKNRDFLGSVKLDRRVSGSKYF